MIFSQLLPTKLRNVLIFQLAKPSLPFALRFFPDVDQYADCVILFLLLLFGVITLVLFIGWHISKLLLLAQYQ